MLRDAPYLIIFTDFEGVFVLVLSFTCCAVSNHKQVDANMPRAVFLN